MDRGPRQRMGSHAIRNTIVTYATLLGVLLIALYFRALNLSNWDNRQGLHPDERYIQYTVDSLRVPHSLHDYFNSDCAPLQSGANPVYTTPLTNPRDPKLPLEQQEPTTTSGCSTLNPFNFNWSRGFVYGTLPTTVVRVVAEAVAGQPSGDGRTVPPEKLIVIGRAVSVGFDILTMLCLFALGRRLYSRRVGLIAAALYGFAVMPIQQAHFFTTDTFGLTFIALALLAAVALVQTRHPWHAVVFGLATGAAIACKINLAAVGAVGLVAGILIACDYRPGLPGRVHRARIYRVAVARAPGWWRGSVARALGLLVIIGVCTFVTFRVAQPNAFTGPAIWNIRPDPRFVKAIRGVLDAINNGLDWPPSHQWANRTPFLYAWSNIVEWGMGVPLGIAAWLGWAVLGWRMLRRRTAYHLIPWFWITLYWLWQGGAFNPTMRYFLPIYPALILCAAWLVDAAAGWARRRAPRGRAVAVGRVAARWATPVVLLTTLLWAWGFTRIYTRPHSRVAATAWINANIAPGSVVTNEQWDDSISGGTGTTSLEMHPYAEDELQKFLGPPGKPEDGLINQLAKADYVALSSARVYGSVVRLPQRFPATIRYYQALFDGSLGFDQVADITSFPTVLGIPIDDSGADEAFTVYDHPRVLIFKRTPRFNADAAQHLLLDNINWDEVYRTSAMQTNQVPTMLRLPANVWQRLTTANSDWSLTAGSPWLTGVLWFVLLELLGLAIWGVWWHFDLPERGRGYLWSRVVGLAVLALPPALLGLVMPVGRPLWGAWYGLVVAFGLRLASLQRGKLVASVRKNRGEFLATQTIYVVMLLAGLGLRFIHPAFRSVAEQFRLATWTSLLRTPVFPAYDPLFAGGQLTVPYAGWLPVVALAKIVGGSSTVLLNLALPTLLALLALAVWAAVAGTLRRPRVGQLLVALLAAAVALLPGIRPLAQAGWNPLAALLNADAELLGGLLLFAAALGLGLAQVRVATRAGWRQSVRLAVWWLPLAALLGGQSAVLLLLVWLVVVASGLFGGRDGFGWFWSQVVVLAGALVLAHPWSATIAPGPNAPISMPAGSTLLMLALPLLFTALYLRRSAARLADRWLVGLVTGFVALWAVVAWLVQRGAPAAGVAMTKTAALFNTPVVFLPTAMALTWLLAVTLWPDRGQRVMRSAWRNTVLAFGALLTAGLGFQALTGKSSANPALLLDATAIMLAVVAGHFLQVLLRSRRTVNRSILAGSAGLVVVLAGFALLRAPDIKSATANAGTDAAPVARALASIDTSSTGTPLVAAADSATALPAPVLTAGFPTLLAAPEREAQLRNYLGASVDRSIAARQRALAAIYGPDPRAAQNALQTYHVDYVLLSDSERARWGGQAGQALNALASSAAITQTFRDGNTVVYQIPAATTPIPFVATTPKLDVPSTKGMLHPSIAELQRMTAIPHTTGLRSSLVAAWHTFMRVDDYAWNGLANSVQPIAVLLWLLVIELLGLLVWPLTRRIFGGWYGAGWGWSKLIGLLLYGYVVWLLTSFHLLPYTWPALLVGLLLTGAFTAWAGGWRPRRAGQSLGATWSAGIREHLPEILRGEALFIGAYLVWVGIRALNPDLWHPFLGGEKPFEFGFLNGIVRSTFMPPSDPFFADGTINYYYYGLYLVSLPIKLTGIAPSIAFNLAVALLFAFVAAGAAAIVRELTGRWRYGLIGTLFVTILGPIGSVMPIGSSKGLAFLLDALRPGLSGWTARVGDWFWGPSRIIDTEASHTINEFPFFSYLFADLHPHMIALPITLLAVALALEVGRRAGLGRQIGRPRLVAPLLLSALVLGTLAVANSWDAPAYGLVIGGTLVGSVWRLSRRDGWSWRVTARRVAAAALVATGVLVAGLAMFLPFFLQFQAMVGGIGKVQASDSIPQFFAIFGTSFFVGVSLIVILSAVTIQQMRWRSRRLVEGVAVTASLLIGAILVSGATFGGQAPAIHWSLRALLLLLVGVAVILALVARLRDTEWFALWLLTVGMLVFLAIQFVYVRDHLDGGAWERMNTVFKFGLQSWTLLALGAAAALPVVVARLRRFSPPVLTVWSGALLALIAAGAVYPIAGTPSRLAIRFPQHPGPTLDGLAFLDTAEYDNEGHHLRLHDDLAGITWLNQHVAGLETVVSNDREFYRTYGIRVGANTGLPMIYGNGHEGEQRPHTALDPRGTDSVTMATTGDVGTTLALLVKYSVRYVYVGPLERAFWSPEAVLKWDQMVGTAVDRVFQQGTVTIYRVRDGISARPAVAGQPAAMAPATPQATVNDDELKNLEAAQAADPASGPKAYALAGAYLKNHRGEDAARVLHQGADSNPQDVALHDLLADVEASLGHADEAEAALQQAVNVQPTLGNYNKLATVMIQLKRWDVAEQALQQARTVDPNSPVPFFSLGELYLARNGDGDRARALDAYEQYLAKAPANDPLHKQAEQRVSQLK